MTGENFVNAGYGFACRINNVKESGKGNVVISGCSVTEKASPDMSVDVAAGVVQIGADYVSVSGVNKAVDAAHATLDRYDVIQVGSNGTVDYVAGTAASNPYPADLSEDHVLLATIFVEHASTVVNTADISDARIIGINYQAGNFIQVLAGENLTAGNVVYIKKSDGKAYISGTGTADDIRANGIVIATVTSGNAATIQTKGKYTTSGLTANDTYYLGAAGGVSQTASGVQVGYSFSTTILMIDILQDDKDAIGTIKPYAKSFIGIPSNNFTAFWKECDGTVLSDAESLLNGQILPDLNTTKRFLRGSSTSGTTGGADTHIHSISNSGGSAGTGGAGHIGTFDSGAGSTLPACYEVVWIIKVK